MEKIKISLFQELYYWTYFYSNKIRKNPPFGIEYTSYMQFSILKVLNLVCLWFLSWYIFKVIGGDIGKNVFFVAFIISGVILLELGYFFIYKKRETIFMICEQFSKKRRTIGKIKFWIYVILTFLSLWYLWYLGDLLDSMR